MIADLAKCTDSHVALSWARSYHRPERPTGTINDRRRTRQSPRRAWTLRHSISPMTATIELTGRTFVVALEFAGTFVFALSGAAAAVKRELDVFGVLVLSFVAASTAGFFATC